MRVTRGAQRTPYHDSTSQTLTCSGYGLATVCTCVRCGASVFVERGERMPLKCTATPEWLRCHNGEAER